MKMLKVLCNETSTSDFYQAIWHAILKAPFARAPALHFLKENLPRKKLEKNGNFIWFTQT